MARERWFYAPTHKRQGPMPLARLVEGLLRLPDPRSCLIWKHGLPAWTPAGEVEEVDRHLAPFVAARRPPAGVGRAAEPAAASRAAAEAGARAEARAQAATGPSPFVYAGAGLGALVLGVLVWVFWPKPTPPRPKDASGAAAPGIITLKEGDPTGGTGGTPGPSSGRAPGQAGFAGWSDREASLPNAELTKLRAVAGWTGQSLEMTVYNGSGWRITEIHVRPRRLVNDAFVEDERPLTLHPAGAAVQQGVDQLMNKVAPDRRKPGVNPLDTGKFLGAAGPRPEAFGATVVGARGYPPN
jgi:hypothetical protein